MTKLATRASCNQPTKMDRRNKRFNSPSAYNHLCSRFRYFQVRRNVAPCRLFSLREKRDSHHRDQGGVTSA
jgi:hypothetical protein